MQPDNGYLIKSYFHNDKENDLELKKMTPFMKFLSNVFDVRNINEWMKKFESMETFDYLDMNLE